MSQLKVMPPVAVTVGILLQPLGVMAFQRPRLFPIAPIYDLANTKRKEPQ
jgi:hypothetical protein